MPIMLKARSYRLLLRAEKMLARVTQWHAEHHRTRLESYFHDTTLTDGDTAGRSLVLYANTIGEYNAVSSFTSAYFDHWPNDKLVVLVSSRRYFDAIARSRPNVNVGVLNWRSTRLHDAFLQRTNPRFLVISEAPCLNGFLPPYPLGLLASCLVHDLPVYVVNACRYERTPLSRLQKMEDICFGDLHQKAIAQWFAPSESMAAQLVDISVPRQHITVVGNLKFDSAQSRKCTNDTIARKKNIHAFRQSRDGPIFVAGNVSEMDEQLIVFSAWQEIRSKYPLSRLIIAPRYLQYERAMSDLSHFLQKEGVKYGLWSKGAKANEGVDALILDTYGELFDFYGIASLCYAGRNHGVLESLGQGRPTLVCTQWNESSGNFEIYRRLVEAGALVQVQDPAELGRVGLRVLDDKTFRQTCIACAQSVINAEKGAGVRTLKFIQTDCRVKP